MMTEHEQRPEGTDAATEQQRSHCRRVLYALILTQILNFFFKKVHNRFPNGISQEKVLFFAIENRSRMCIAG